MFHRSKYIITGFKNSVKFFSSIKEKNTYHNIVSNEFFNNDNLYFDNNCRKTRFDDKLNILRNNNCLTNVNNTHKQKLKKYPQYLSDKFEG